MTYRQVQVGAYVVGGVLCLLGGLQHAVVRQQAGRCNLLGQPRKDLIGNIECIPSADSKGN